ncbi:hypothetical protein C1J03_08035 [Sulfitobacter sp. SK012]|nr:hypothetical protein C1J03_08035 [Sulfitobacter sp. SK012]
MRLNPVNLKRHLTALGAALLLCGAVNAQSDDSELLQRLQEAAPEEVANLQRDVERSWATSGSAAMDLLLKRGRDALAVGEFATAIDHLTALTDHAPDFAEGYHARATAYFQADLYGPALDDLETALALNPDNYNAVFGLGVILLEFGDTRRAAELFRKVIVLNPHHENAATALEALKRDGIGRTL